MLGGYCILVVVFVGTQLDKVAIVQLGEQLSALKLLFGKFEELKLGFNLVLVD